MTECQRWSTQKSALESNSNTRKADTQHFAVAVDAAGCPQHAVIACQHTHEKAGTSESAVHHVAGHCRARFASRISANSKIQITQGAREHAHRSRNTEGCSHIVHATVRSIRSASRRRRKQTNPMLDQHETVRDARMPHRSVSANVFCSTAVCARAHLLTSSTSAVATAANTQSLTGEMIGATEPNCVLQSSSLESSAAEITQQFTSTALFCAKSQRNSFSGKVNTNARKRGPVGEGSAGVHEAARQRGKRRHFRRRHGSVRGRVAKADDLSAQCRSARTGNLDARTVPFVRNAQACNIAASQQ